MTEEGDIDHVLTNLSSTLLSHWE